MSVFRCFFAVNGLTFCFRFDSARGPDGLVFHRAHFAASWQKMICGGPFSFPKIVICLPYFA
jgi:hypothetical protein